MASAKLNSSLITNYFPPSPARDAPNETEADGQTTSTAESEQVLDQDTKERLSTSSVFITPNQSPDKDEVKKSNSDVANAENDEKVKDPLCKKTLTDKLNSIATEELKESPRPRSRRRGRKKKQAVNKPEQTNGTLPNGPAKPKAPRKKKTETDGLKDTLVTDYFAVRRSDRRSKTELQKEKEEDLETKILTGCEDGLEVVEFDNKGRGVIARKLFKRGDFVVEYCGDLISIPEANERETKYAKDPTKGCYMYYFYFKNRKYCIDATAESGKLGRLLNHSKTKGNCHTRQVEVKGQPYLILVASREITEGEELLYDYGDRSREALESHPWLKS